MRTDQQWTRPPRESIGARWSKWDLLTKLAVVSLVVASGGVISWVADGFAIADRFTAKRPVTPSPSAMLNVAPEPPPAACGQNNSPDRFSVVISRDGEDATGQCIGYSDGEDLMFGSGKALPEAQSRIFRYNREVERMAKEGWPNPRVRLVMMTALTTKLKLPADERYPAEREAMEGIAIAQHLALKNGKDTPSRPLLEVVVANAGQGGEHVDILLPKIKELAQSDPTVTAVLVAMDSRTSTRTAMQELQSYGLLVLTSTGAADRLGEGMTRFLQLQTTTREQSRLIRSYAKHLGLGSIINIYTIGNPPPTPKNADLYVDDFRAGLRKEFGDGYQERQWGATGFDLRDWCHDRYDGIVFYGGRYTEFDGFLKEVYRTCRKGNLPILVGAGNTSRYVVGDPETNGRDVAPSDYPFVFSSNGVASATCKPKNPGNLQFFLEAVKQVLGRCQDATDVKPLGVRTGPAFDIINIMLDSVARQTVAGVKEITGAGIHTEIMERNRQQAFEGVSGPIHFDDNGVIDSGGESLMCLHNIREAYVRNTRGTIPYEVATTGAHGSPIVGKDDCPHP